MIVIPARLESTRFERKILHKIDGVEMFIQTARNAAKVGEVLIACDDEITAKIAEKYGFKAILTSKDHVSGTDRINEAVSSLKLNADEIIINVQADEPFFEAENLADFANFAKVKINSGAFMASCYKVIDEQSAKDPNLVKVVLDASGDAIYFSRSVIPYPRATYSEFKGHVGIYAYSVANLREFCALKTSELENIEKLEQLRAIASNKKISMLKITTNSVGIDTLDDYLKAAKIFGFKSGIE